MSRTSVFAALALVCGQILLSGGVAHGQRPQPTPGVPSKAILPVAPADLLACMPPTPKGWTLVRSMASNDFSTWMITNADRDLKQDPPPPDPNAASPAPAFVPGTISIRLTDAGLSADFASTFVAPANGSLPKNTSLLKIGEFPARRLKFDDVTTIYNLLVKDRFLVEVRAQHMLDKDIVDYVSHVDYPRLLLIPDTGPHTLPKPMILTRVNELDPRQTRSYPVYWSGGKPK